MKKHLENFELLEQIDAPGHTTVYRAVEDMGQGITRPAAVKILRTWNMNDEEQVNTLKREVELLVDLGACPNIVTTYGFGIDEEIGPWIAMELAGRSLKHLISEEPADPDQVRVMMRDALRAMTVCHGQDPPVLHRDVKPNNILSTKFGIWQISDFGLAKRHESDDTLELATVQYSAPELLDGTLGPESPRMDLYSLGMAAYEYALGRELYRKQFPSIYDPYAGRKDDASDDRPKWMYWHTSLQMTVPPLAEIIEGFPEDLSDLIASMMAKPFRDRIGTAEEALARLGDVESALVLPGDQARAREEESSEGSSTRSLALALVVVALIVVVGGLIYLQIPSAPEIELPDDGSFVAAQPEIRVVGQIRNFPDSGAASVMLRGGSSYPAVVDDDGNFTSQVRLARLGQADAMLNIRNKTGEVIANKKITLERTAPEVVDLVITTRPATPNADVVIIDRSQPDQPVRTRTDLNGVANAPVTYGAFDLEITHPRFKSLAGTLPTGIDPVKEVTANLVELSAEHIASKRERLLSEMDALAEAAANGDVAAQKRLQEIREQLRHLEPMKGDTAAARRVALLEELDEVAARAAAGDPAAVKRLREINEELRRLASGEDESGRQVARGGSGGGQAEPLDPKARRAALIREMADIAQRAAAGDPAAIQRLRELQRELAQIEEEDPGTGSAIARRRQDLLAELAVMTELAAAGDPNAIARVKAIQRELGALEAIEAAQGDSSRLAQAGLQLLGDSPTLDLIDRTTLLQLPPDQFKAFIEVNVPLGSLTVEHVPNLSKLRVSGPVFNEREQELLMTRLEPAMPRLQLEIRIDAWAVCRRLEKRLVDQGAEDVRVHAHLALGDNALFVLTRRNDLLTSESLLATARPFVIDRDLLFIQQF